MQPGTPPTQAFQLQEMGTDGTGSLERSDLESTKFWCGYPTPFLEHYFKTFPEEEADAPAPAPPGSGGSGEAQTAIDTSDSNSAFPKLRNGKAEVFRYWTINSDELIEMGKHAGQYSADSDQGEVLRAVPRQRGRAQGGLLGRGRCGIFIGGRGGRGGFVVGCRRRGIVNI